jgi:hypothetical protein
LLRYDSLISILLPDPNISSQCSLITHQVFIGVKFRPIYFLGVFCHIPVDITTYLVYVVDTTWFFRVLRDVTGSIFPGLLVMVLYTNSAGISSGTAPIILFRPELLLNLPLAQEHSQFIQI